VKLPANARIYVATIAVDMRCGFDGLAALARAYVDREVKDSDALFVFFNRRVDRVKLVWWERTGYCLFYKRLERGRFHVPQPVHVGATSLSIDMPELELILDGIGLSEARLRTRHR
jgi:transposase